MSKKDNICFQIICSEKSEKIEILLNDKGADIFIDVLKSLKELKEEDHFHLMSPSWGGETLSEDIPVVPNNKLVHHLKIYKIANEKDY